METVNKYRIVFFALCANVCTFSVGTYIGWSSPTIPKLKDPSQGSPLDYSVSTSQEGWISSLTAIGALCTSLIAGPLAAKIGRKWSLILCSALLIVAYVCVLVTRTIWLIYIGRFLHGCAGGLVFTILPIYAGEIATDDIRGVIGSLTSFFLVGGIVFTYCIGPFVSYWTLQWCCLAVAIIALVAFSVVPESPYFLAMKGRTSDGVKVLKLLRGQNLKAAQTEMTNIQLFVDSEMCNSSTIMDLLCNNAYRKALFICSGLLIFQQFTGMAAITYNSQTIFTSAGSYLDPAYSTIILGVTQLMSNFFTSLVIEHIGRKTILMVGALGMCISLVTLGTFFYIQEFGDASAITWIPIPALIFFNIVLGFGFGPMPYVMMGEMFPSNIKSKASTITSSLMCISKFVVVQYYPAINALGTYYAFWGFGGVAVLAFFFVLFFTIETKGLSFESIQMKLGPKKTVQNNLRSLDPTCESKI